MNGTSPWTGSPSAQKLAELRANLEALINRLAGHLFALDEELACLVTLKARWSEKALLVTNGPGLLAEQAHQIEQSLRETATETQLATRSVEELVTKGSWLLDQLARVGSGPPQNQH